MNRYKNIYSTNHVFLFKIAFNTLFIFKEISGDKPDVLIRTFKGKD